MATFPPPPRRIAEDQQVIERMRLDRSILE
jgi:hypothetical protein